MLGEGREGATVRRTVTGALCSSGLHVNYCGLRNGLNDFSRIWSGPLSVP